MVRLGLREFEQLKTLAEAAYPEEFCAILLGRVEDGECVIERVLPARNEHENPRRGYSIPAVMLIAAQRKAREAGQQILGFVHSHPDQPPAPSESDLREAWWLEHAYGIARVSAGHFDAMEFYRLVGTMVERRFEPVEFCIG